MVNAAVRSPGARRHKLHLNQAELALGASCWPQSFRCLKVTAIRARDGNAADVANRSCRDSGALPAVPYSFVPEEWRTGNVTWMAKSAPASCNKTETDPPDWP